MSVLPFCFCLGFVELLVSPLLLHNLCFFIKCGQSCPPILPDGLDDFIRPCNTALTWAMPIYNVELNLELITINQRRTIFTHHFPYICFTHYSLPLLSVS